MRPGKCLGHRLGKVTVSVLRARLHQSDRDLGGGLVHFGAYLFCQGNERVLFQRLPCAVQSVRLGRIRLDGGEDLFAAVVPALPPCKFGQVMPAKASVCRGDRKVILHKDKCGMRHSGKGRDVGCKQIRKAFVKRAGCKGMGRAVGTENGREPCWAAFDGEHAKPTAGAADRFRIFSCGGEALCFLHIFLSCGIAFCAVPLREPIRAEARKAEAFVQPADLLYAFLRCVEADGHEHVGRAVFVKLFLHIGLQTVFFLYYRISKGKKQ